MNLLVGNYEHCSMWDKTLDDEKCMMMGLIGMNSVIWLIMDPMELKANWSFSDDNIDYADDDDDDNNDWANALRYPKCSGIRQM